jgi:hypothetical protein
LAQDFRDSASFADTHEDHTLLSVPPELPPGSVAIAAPRVCAQPKAGQSHEQGDDRVWNHTPLTIHLIYASVTDLETGSQP